MVATISSVVLCCGLWIKTKPQASGQPAESIQGILMEHIEYLPEVYRAHENYVNCLHEDTCAVLIYRYSSSGCSPCYMDDLSELKEFRKAIGKDITLVLPAYPTNDRNSRIRMANETMGFKYRNIPADSLLIPVHNGVEKRYFAIIDSKGQINMVFFPVRGRPYLTRQYFREVARFFPEQTDAKKESVVITP